MKGTNVVIPEVAEWGLGHSLHMVDSCQCSTNRDPYICIPMGLKQINVEFLTDTGNQISVLHNQRTEQLGIKRSRKDVNIKGVMGTAEKCPIARTQFWVPGEKQMMAVEVALSPYKGNMLGFDVLADRWCLSSNFQEPWGRSPSLLQCRNLKSPVFLKSLCQAQLNTASQ